MVNEQRCAHERFRVALSLKRGPSMLAQKARSCRALTARAASPGPIGRCWQRIAGVIPVSAQRDSEALQRVQGAEALLPPRATANSAGARIKQA